nr:hypothetical protein [Pandoravirus massiliensis]
MPSSPHCVPTTAVTGSAFTKGDTCDNDNDDDWSDTGVSSAQSGTVEVGVAMSLLIACVRSVFFLFTFSRLSRTGDLFLERACTRRPARHALSCGTVRQRRDQFFCRAVRSPARARSDAPHGR